MPAAIGAVGTFLASGTAAAFVAGAALNVVGLIALSAVERALLSRKSKGDSSPGFGSRTVTETGADTHRKILYGTVTTSGQLTFIQEVPPDNMAWWEVHTFSGHEIDGFVSLHLDDYPVIDLATEVDGNGWVTNPAFIDADGNRLVRLQWAVGTDNDTVLTRVQAEFPALWTSAHRGRGCSKLAVRFAVDQSDTAREDPDASVWAAGYPDRIQVRARGKKVYDPRNPAHDINDSSTWEWSDRPALCAPDLARDVRLGAAWQAGFIGFDSVAAAANRCDEAETVYSGVGDGSTVDIPRYRCDGVLSTQTETLQNIDVLVESMAGNRGFPAGVFELNAGGYDAPVITLSDEDRQGNLTWQPSQSGLDAYNSTRGLFWSPGQNAFTDFAPRVDAVWLAEDGGQKWQDFRFPVTDNEQRAQWLAKVSANVARVGTFEGEFSHRALGVKRGETIAITNALRGWVAKEFRVTKKSIVPVIGDDGHAIGLTVQLAGYESLPATWQVPLAELVDVQPRGTLDSTAPTPLPPSGLIATGRAGSIALDWSNPDTEGIAYVEVWRVASADGNRANAERISTQRGESMVDAYTDRAANTAMGPDESYDYWVRSIGRSNKKASAWHPLSATAGVTATSLDTGGGNGEDGRSVALLKAYRRSATPPSPATGGSFNFDTQTLTPPSGWSVGTPSGTDPVYSINSVASVIGQSGTDSNLTWTAPELEVQNGADGQDGSPGADGQDGTDGAPGT
ncbi:MAG: hypothetical protein AAGA95_10260, partial [Pseudomonadota bacterium]